MAGATTRPAGKGMGRAVGHATAGTGLPAPERRSRGCLVGIGVGPGDPELLTVKAVREIRRCSVIAVPTTGRGFDGDSVALSAVRPYLRPDHIVVHLVFPMTRATGVLETAWSDGAFTLCDHLQRGRDVAFVTIGDPMLYSTFDHILRLVEARGFPVCSVPGVPSFCAAASLALSPLCQGEESLVIMPAPRGEDGAERVARVLDSSDTVVFVKAGERLPGLLELLDRTGRLESSYLVERCGLEGERVVFDMRSLNGAVSYLSLVVSRRCAGRRGRGRGATREAGGAAAVQACAGEAGPGKAVLSQAGLGGTGLGRAGED